MIRIITPLALLAFSQAQATSFYDILIKDKSNEYSVHIGFNDPFTGSQLKKTIENNEKIPATKQTITRAISGEPLDDHEIVGPGDKKRRSLVIYVEED